MTFRADLHCHSTCSDGTFTPQELVDMALQNGLQALSITDHDSIDAYHMAKTYAEEKGLILLPGVEFSANLQNKSVHILGYCFDVNHPAILHLCKKHHERRLERNLKILENLENEGLKIDPKELFSIPSSTLGRPHIAALLIQKGYVKDFSEAFHLYLGDGKKCYAEGTPIGIADTLDAIHAAKGLAVLAHPHLYKERAFVLKILTFPFDGLEVEYALMNESQNASWIKLAKKRPLLLTGGSDFHGTSKPNISLGSRTISWEKFEPLFKHFLRLKTSV